MTPLRSDRGEPVTDRAAGLQSIASPVGDLVVVTRQPDWTSPAVERAGSVDEAIAMASIGGGRAHQLEFTHIHCDLDGDVRFPHVDPRAWHPVTREMGDGLEWVTYRRL